MDTSFARYTNCSEKKEIKEDELISILLAAIQKDPSTYEEAINSEDREMRIKAIREELQSMRENDVWEIINRPKQNTYGKSPNIIDSK